MMYRKVCRNCKKVFKSEDYSDIAPLVLCDACFEALPDNIEQIDEQAKFKQAENRDIAEGVFGDDGASGFGAEAFGFPMPAEAAFVNSSTACIDPKAGHEAFGMPAEAHEPEQDAPRTRAHELLWVGTNRTSALPVILPDSLDGGYVGRDPMMCEAEIDKPTISRIQFAYKNADAGIGIEITNYSQFGTWVNGQLLQRNEAAIAPPGSTIEMGGFTFELRERDE